jgi:hypothetical protein
LSYVTVSVDVDVGKLIFSLLLITHLLVFSFQKVKVNVLLICGLPKIPAIIVILKVFGALDDQLPAFHQI